MKKADLILICIFLLAGGTIVLFQSIKKEPGKQVVITVDSKVYKTLSLEKDQELRVECGENHYNIVKIQDGKASVSEADCKNQVCVKSAQISNEGESIACLPHKVIVKIVAADSGIMGGEHE